ncbi:hypothetical protein Acr_00g0068810 [Actinidia rufa]|uniref:Uncharacterized protein n=1 Tax=Actinidia rufa TaxID=165716 RepID=A0A7J0DQU7_9ERIC|nr:hypothetical protein Acr_00g0068810 [Actinidia rufa]
MTATGSDATEHVGIHERDALPPTGKGKRGKSADIMSSLEARHQRVELVMADNRDKVEDIDQRIDGLEGAHEEFHGEIQGAINSLAESWKAQLDALKDSLQTEIAAIREEISQSNGGHKPPSSSHNKFNKDKRSGDKPKLACFLCDGNHFARDCPKRAKLSALIQNEEEEPHHEETKMGSLRLLNTIKAKVDLAKTTKKGRMYVEVKVRGFNTRALVDTSPIKEEQGWIKAVNSEARPIYGVARDVWLHISNWCGQVDFSVMPMDDYPIVLGIEFLDGMRAFPIPFAETMHGLVVRGGSPS